MAKLNTTQVNGNLRASEQIAQNGQKIDSKYIASAEISGYVVTLKAADGTIIGTFTLPQ